MVIAILLSAVEEVQEEKYDLPRNHFIHLLKKVRIRLGIGLSFNVQVSCKLCNLIQRRRTRSDKEERLFNNDVQE